MSNSQTDVDQANSSFWDDLCGSHLASVLGVTDSTPSSLKKFDDWYMDYYPYLLGHIPFGSMAGKDVLEVGLGYGTVSQKIMLSGAQYSGLDIAAGPVAMCNDRANQIGREPGARQGSILHAPFRDATFDYVVAIGCLHHTGDLQGAINECLRVLRPGGRLIFMVYYAYSLRRFQQARSETLRYLKAETFGYRGPVFGMRAAERASYDKNSAGDAAPHTDFISRRSLAHLCRGFTKFSSRVENWDDASPFKTSKRADMIGSVWPRFLGLDLYATATK
ncbi:class I SAM-dependent methyltransferase [Bosea robiniae]|uniref:Methyltransferase domain-containing protein n=1 Tax=Bosea robiniae TaxID=1036780 RepID=A0ABY0P279_9HYPH|nr:class I SAM-dependent methyltransferase [Bosea robiniae]SDG75341.1 Methyltransferase domain-containing protein [Bosea robiniae]